ncbi:hypothetical protein [Nocardia sp. NPDC051981]|uniref:hypothetical protein n=1 Tax=Nocardia sp. NPDC051981 TaxID=3155417 RepID=UPI00341E73DD
MSSEGLDEEAFQITALAAVLERTAYMVGDPGALSEYPHYRTVHADGTAAQAGGVVWLPDALGPELIIRAIGAATIAITGKIPVTGDGATAPACCSTRGTYSPTSTS